MHNWQRMSLGTLWPEKLFSCIYIRYAVAYFALLVHSVSTQCLYASLVLRSGTSLHTACISLLASTRCYLVPGACALQCTPLLHSALLYGYSAALIMQTCYRPGQILAGSALFKVLLSVRVCRRHLGFECPLHARLERAICRFTVHVCLPSIPCTCALILYSAIVLVGVVSRVPGACSLQLFPTFLAVHSSLPSLSVSACRRSGLKRSVPYDCHLRTCNKAGHTPCRPEVAYL